MSWSRSKSPSAVAPPERGTDASADELLTCVIEELSEGRARNDIVFDLVKHGWDKKSAQEFCRLAGDITREILTSPDQRAGIARRGIARIQASYGWIGAGIVIFLVMYFGIDGLRQYAVWSLAIAGYGLIELMSGATLWWPHRDYLRDSTTGQLIYPFPTSMNSR